MPRSARIVVPGLPHHVTQRGNRREPIFFEEGDQEVYRDLLAEQLQKCGVEVWAWCLMPNHVHLILVPKDDIGLSRAIGAAHRRYTHFVNARGRWTGHLFQSRFASVAMDEGHLVAAVRYVSLNPVRAQLVTRAEDWPWSSVRAHLSGQDDGLVTVAQILARIADFPPMRATPALPPYALRKAQAGRSAMRNSSQASNAFLEDESQNAHRVANQRRATIGKRCSCEFARMRPLPGHRKRSNCPGIPP